MIVQDLECDSVTEIEAGFPCGSVGPCTAGVPRARTGFLAHRREVDGGLRHVTHKKI